MPDLPIIDAEFEVIEPGDRATIRAPGEAHPYTEIVCHWIVGIAFTALAIWARPYGMHLIDQLLFHKP